MCHTVRSVSIDSENYPESLRNINDRPIIFYYKGFLNALVPDKCLAVVGSRRMTIYGRRVTEKIVYEVASRGITIVSGFMYGIDATSHKAALSAGGRTVAIMPCGINRVHPAYQRDLYQEILDSGGLIISEYPGNEQPQLWTYPRRNRIVAGLCKATLIVEAAISSGSLITANLAKEFGRKTLAVPGPITSTTSAGTNELIKSGAILIRNSQDILSVYGLGYDDLPIFEVKNNILAVLSREPMCLDELCEALDFSVAELGSKITVLLLSGQIVEEGGRYYVN